MSKYLLIAALVIIPGCHIGAAWKTLWAQPDPNTPSQGEKLGGAVAGAVLNPTNPLNWIEIAKIAGGFVIGAVTGVQGHKSHTKRKKAKAAKASLTTPSTTTLNTPATVTNP